MDPSKALIAPQAMMIAAVTQGIFLDEFNNIMFSIGVLLAIIVACIDHYLEKSLLLGRVKTCRAQVIGEGIGFLAPQYRSS